MIVVAGEALVDLVVTTTGVTAAAGGAPYNVARACARLGEPVALVASVSDDGFGRRLVDGLADAGVDRALLQRTGHPTTLAVAQVDDAGAADYTFYATGTSAPSLQQGPVPEGTTTLVTGGLGLVLEPMASAVERLVLSAGPDVLVVLDVNCRPAVIGDRLGYVERVRRVVARADVVKVSDEDLGYLAPGTSISDAAADLLAAGSRAVLVTAGATATSVFTAAGVLTVPVAPVAVVDTIGAGDAFTAGFVTWWRSHGLSRSDLDRAPSLAPAVEAAHAVAAVVVSRRGADPPTRDELPPPW